MIIRSKAPLRLGLAGGGTDVSPYCDKYGGCVLNATIDMYSYCSIEPLDNNRIQFYTADRGEHFETDISNKLKINGILDLHKGVYNRIVKEYNNCKPLSFKMTTYSDAPAGSGLGTSSTLVVAIVKAFVELLNLPLGDYDIAHLSYEIERKDIGLSGGKQDQYSATFGGFNFMEFYENERVIINPLRIKSWIIDELESSLVLYFIGSSRESAKIIDEQIKNTQNNNIKAINAMHKIKESALDMKEAILKGDFTSFSKILSKSWTEKKKMAKLISNKQIDKIYNEAIEAGAISGKVSGAGGGGFMMFFVDPVKKINVIKVLNKSVGKVINCHFINDGAKSWKIL